jgi:hypothetical protein
MIRETIIQLYIKGGYSINNNKGYIMIFVLITILLTGIVSASLINKTLLHSKIQSNFIARQKAILTARSGVILLSDFLKNDNNINYTLDLSYGKDYNIRINMEKDNKYKDGYRYLIEGDYKDNSHNIYIKNDN